MEDIIVHIIVMAVLFLFPAWRIFKRAGLSPAASLTVLIPYVGFILCGIILAASKWDIGATKQGEA